MKINWLKELRYRFSPRKNRNLPDTVLDGITIKNMRSAEGIYISYLPCPGFDDVHPKGSISVSVIELDLSKS